VRVNLYWRGRDVLDVELHQWRKREDTPPHGSPPKLEATGGGQAERADTFGDPDTIVSFGFGRPES
jgi:hypothetical protein